MAPRELKLCLLGDAGCGKSSIAQQFVHGHCPTVLEPTIGASFLTKTIDVDDKQIKFALWDTAGQEKYRGLAPMYYRGAAAAVIVYDITRRNTFEHVRSWVSELSSMGPAGVMLAIAGNKADLETQRQVTLKEGQDYANSVGALFIETSALKAKGVGQLFQQLGRWWCCFKLLFSLQVCFVSHVPSFMPVIAVNVMKHRPEPAINPRMSGQLQLHTAPAAPKSNTGRGLFGFCSLV
eukprot:TRINITY_DN4640_c0_g1_i1.p1 TRINITY_DN4640_c0_g1~~TRINITY_DN4640_c0_g1_i1.p1  ORF type:complete len:236 (+),score=32.19 TRINITY_DN4640_c0_g1_i1:325-1032(+)